MAGLDDLIRRTVGPAIRVTIVESAGLWNVLVDPNQMENALLNLCINARDAMPNGGTLSIETGNHGFNERAALEPDSAPGEYVSLCVRDDGAGMAPEVLAKAFEPFFTTKPTGEGTGLGLSMIYGFVRQSGGRVRIDSALGRGTTVCIYLPRHPGGADPPAPSAPPAKLMRAAAGEVVLVVEDDATVRMLVTDMLHDLGYDTIAAEDGVAGLALLRADQRIDLLVTDIGLPGGIDGRQLGEQARARRPDLRILYITGYAELPEGAAGALDARVSTLTKPFSMPDLAARIDALLRKA